MLFVAYWLVFLCCCVLSGSGCGLMGVCGLLLSVVCRVALVCCVFVVVCCLLLRDVRWSLRCCVLRVAVNLLFVLSILCCLFLIC